MFLPSLIKNPPCNFHLASAGPFACIPRAAGSLWRGSEVETWTSSPREASGGSPWPLNGLPGTAGARPCLFIYLPHNKRQVVTLEKKWCSSTNTHTNTLLSTMLNRELMQRKWTMYYCQNPGILSNAFFVSHWTRFISIHYTFSYSSCIQARNAKNLAEQLKSILTQCKISTKMYGEKVRGRSSLV